MRTAVLLVAVAAAATLAAQGPLSPPQDKPPQKAAPLRDEERAIVVEGCIWGGDRLKVDSTVSSLTIRMLETSEFLLDAPKETLQMLRSLHDGHQDEISGIVVIPASRRNDGDFTQSKEIGDKTRITVGTRSGTSGAGDTPDQVRKGKALKLKVTSLRHLADKCSIPG